MIGIINTKCYIERNIITYNSLLAYKKKPRIIKGCLAFHFPLWFLIHCLGAETHFLARSHGFVLSSFSALKNAVWVMLCEDSDTKTWTFLNFVKMCGLS